MPGWLQRAPLFNLFLQSPCPLCQRPTSGEFCSTCHDHLQQAQLADSGQLWASQALFAWGDYGGNLKQTIALLKYANAPHLARPLGQWLAQAWLASGLEPRRSFTIVPIPLHPDKQQKRGYNQAELIARSFCQFTGYRLQNQGLERIRSTEAQFNLSATQREQNLHQAFQVGQKCRDRLPSHPIILLDDIYTTGATARAAIQVLRRQGVSVRGMITVAKTAMRRSP
jgi:ComF family protein